MLNTTGRCEVSTSKCGPGIYPLATGMAGQENPPDMQQLMKMFWARRRAEVESATEWKHQIPVSRIKKIVHSWEGVNYSRAEVPLLLEMAAEFFIMELTLRAYNTRKQSLLRRSDVISAIQQTDSLDFLLDIAGDEMLAGEPAGRAPVPAAGTAAAAALALGTKLLGDPMQLSVQPELYTHIAHIMAAQQQALQPDEVRLQLLAQQSALTGHPAPVTPAAPAAAGATASPATAAAIVLPGLAHSQASESNLIPPPHVVAHAASNSSSSARGQPTAKK